MNASAHPMPTIRDAAFEYAARGWHVFPAPPGLKKSHLAERYAGGRKWGATTDPATITRVWRRWPEANVGIVCGPKSGFFVVEADTPDGHMHDGVSNLRALIAKHGDLPHTIEAESPTGSWHLYFKWPEGATITNSPGGLSQR
jgi:putative DNA primase/helicase